MSKREGLDAVQALFGIVIILVRYRHNSREKSIRKAQVAETVHKTSNSRTGFLWPVRNLCFHLLLSHQSFVHEYSIYLFIVERTPDSLNCLPSLPMFQHFLGKQRTSLQAINE